MNGHQAVMADGLKYFAGLTVQQMKYILTVCFYTQDNLIFKYIKSGLQEMQRFQVGGFPCGSDPFFGFFIKWLIVNRRISIPAGDIDHMPFLLRIQIRYGENVQPFPGNYGFGLGRWIFSG